MAYARYESVAVNTAGDVIPNATIEVREDRAGRPVVPLWANRDGTEPLGNPIKADELGKFGFYAKGGSYYIRVFTGPSQQPFLQYVRRHQAIGTAAERDVEDLATALETGTATFATLAELEAFVPSAQGVGGKVTTGPDAGFYHRNWVTNEWVFNRALFDTLARMVVTGGTADAIEADLETGVADSAVVMLWIESPANNIGPVTINGKPVLSIDGAELLAGQWLEGRTYWFTDEGDHYKLRTESDVSGLVAQAEAAAGLAQSAASAAEGAAGASAASANEAAEYAAGLNLPSIAPGDAGKQLIVADDEEGYQLRDAPVGGIPSRAWAIANLHPAVAPDGLRTDGFAVAGDGGGALYKKVASEPSHGGKLSITLAGGSVVWYELSVSEPSASMFGAVGDAVTSSVGGTATITAGSPNLTMTGTNFQSGDVGKVIMIPGAGASGGVLLTTIAARASTTQITLGDNAATAISGAATSAIYGTDNTTALQAAMAYIVAKNRVAGPETWGGVQGSYAGSYPTLALHNGRYITDTLNIPAYFRLVGENNSALIAKSPNNDILYGDGNYQFFCEGINFVGGRHQIYLRNANIDKTMWKIERFQMRMSTSYAVKTEATGGTWTHLSANLTLRSGVLENCNKFLDNCCDSCIVDDVWGQPNKTNYDSGSAWIRNRGTTGIPRLLLRNFFGVPVMGTAVAQSTTTTNASTSATFAAANSNIVAGMRVTGTGIQANTTVVSCAGTALVLSLAATASATNTLQFSDRVPSCRWIDNYGGVTATGCRFGGESAGMAVISHNSAPPTAYPWEGDEIVLKDCWLYSGPGILSDSGAILLQAQMPQRITIEDCTGPTSSPLIVNIGASINAAWFTAWETATGQKAYNYFKIKLAGNKNTGNGGTVYNALIPSVLRPYLVGSKQTTVVRTTNQALLAGSVSNLVSFNTTPEYDKMGGFAGANPTKLAMPVNTTKMRISGYVQLAGRIATDITLVNVVNSALTVLCSTGLVSGLNVGGDRYAFTADVYGLPGDAFHIEIKSNATALTLNAARVSLTPLDLIE